MVKVAILGFGTVGSGIAEVLEMNKEVIARKAGQEVEVKYILDLREFPGHKFESKIVHDFEVIAADPEVEIVAEAMGGTEPAFTFAKRCLTSGKSFCTSNKELVAKHGPELIALARENGENFMFEASVGGGIPLIRPLLNAVTADEIGEIQGILNGTTNYILTKMDREGLDFDTVLKEAQEKGYAEKNPSADVDGFDACRKIAILASLAYGKHVDFEDIYTEGITKITTEDFAYAHAMGRDIKLIGRAGMKDGKYFAALSPLMIGMENPLFSVSDVFNAVKVHGNAVDDIMFYGRGAGMMPTASAVVNDIVCEAKNLHKNVHVDWDAEKLELMDFKKIEGQFFVRVKGDWTAEFPKVQKAFKGTDVDLVQVAGLDDEFAFVTGRISEEAYDAAVAGIQNVLSMIRFE